METRIIPTESPVASSAAPLEIEDKSARERELETIEGETALTWVAGQNVKTKAALCASPSFQKMEKLLLDSYEDKRKIPDVSMDNGYLYNFWEDDEYVQGLWRRTTLAEYVKPEPKWENLINVDHVPDEAGWLALTDEEKSDDHWVFVSASKNPEGTRALVVLSLGGTDANIMREFDITRKEFVKDGFFLRNAKSTAEWRDNDSLWIGTDLGEGSLTESGYPRKVKLWRRGESLAEAKQIYECLVTDNETGAATIDRPEGSYHFITRATGFYETEYFLVNADLSLTKLPMPSHVELKTFFNGQAIICLREDWRTEAGQLFKTGSVLALDLASIADPARLKLSLIFEPTATCFMSDVSATKSHVLISALNNVCSEIHRYEQQGDHWVSSRLNLPDFGKAEVSAADSMSDDLFMEYANFITPRTLYYYSASSNSVTALKSAPALFDATDMVVNQIFAVSPDGTRVPYFITHRKDLSLNGTNPTLIYGYGGFEIAIPPSYFGVKGKIWLEEGGVFVIANIRGGGEYGPKWHQAALKENRHKAFEDFIAVAEDLIARKVTAPKYLGIKGGSNGGLLVSTVMTMRPDLYNAVICECPLTDMLHFHKMMAGPSWMSEYGDPKDPTMREAFMKYSPFQNVREDISYPQILIKTSTADDRVHPGHARKLADKMITMGHPVYFYENTEGGHAGASNLKQDAFSDAMNYSYLMQKLMKYQMLLVKQTGAKNDGGSSSSPMQVSGAETGLFSSTHKRKAGEAKLDEAASKKLSRRLK